MVWEHGSRILEIGHIGHLANEGRTRVGGCLLPALGFLIFIMMLAVVVLVWVSNTDFDTERTKVPLTPGPCEPFCTGAPPQPGSR
ncbi:hypothetical protein [Nocardia anaemiae]|uniref:hypothetical protein n=1 Tax=Nocardia anaemiae TaxID=263910 RepID=UPI0007A3A3B7|nr:hypothetical protein [Nocardia anaemiae]